MRGKALSACLVAGALSLCAAPAVQADPLLGPNQGKPRSIDSGLSPVKPCDGAQTKLAQTFQAAGRRFSISWRVLAAITKVESNFGCDLGPSSAGAVGWTQFMPSTWRSWGMDADGDKKADPKNSVDAIFSAARYLRASGAPGDYRKALYAYNHADWYVEKVLKTAKQFDKFSRAEFQKMAEIARSYKALEERLHSANEKLDELSDKSKVNRRKIKQSKRTLNNGKKILAKAERQAEASKDRLDRATLKFVQTAQGLQAGQEGQGTSEQQLLAYMGDSRPQDAVLVYVSARSILKRQNLEIQQLRLLAEEAARAATESQRLSDEQDMALKTLRASRKQMQVIGSDQRQTIYSAGKSMRYKARVVRRYAARYLKATGDEGSLKNSPFSDLIEGSVLWGGKWRWPISGPVTSGFGYRCLDFCRVHEGLDIGANTGVKIRSSGPGKVVFAGLAGGYGNMVEVDHGNGYHTRYGHMSRIESRVGQRVTPQTILGRVGCTGHCFGPHLHFEIRVNGTAKNPLPYLPKR